MKEDFNIKGIVKVCNFDKEKEKEIKNRVDRGEHLKDIIKDTPHDFIEFNNLILDSTLNEICQYLVHYAMSYPITHIDIGTGTGAVLPTEYGLKSFKGRFPISNSYIDTTDGFSVVIELFLGTNQANFTWQELGLVKFDYDAGYEGYVSIVSQAIEKTSLNAKCIIWEIKIGRGA